MKPYLCAAVVHAVVLVAANALAGEESCVSTYLKGRAFTSCEFRSREPIRLTPPPRYDGPYSYDQDIFDNFYERQKSRKQQTPRDLSLIHI